MDLFVFPARMFYCNVCSWASDWCLVLKIDTYITICRMYVSSDSWTLDFNDIWSLRLAQQRLVIQFSHLFSHIYRNILATSLDTLMPGFFYSLLHYNDVIMNTMAFQITSLTIVYSMVCSGADQRKHQSSASLDFVREIHRGLYHNLTDDQSTMVQVMYWCRPTTSYY